MLQTTEPAALQAADRWVQLDNNETPYPPPGSVQAAIRTAGTDLHRYPETDSAPLTRALAGHLGVGADQVVVTPGSGALLLEVWQLVARGHRHGVVFAAPNFPLYDSASARSGLTPVRVPLRADGTHDIDAMIVAANDPATGLLVLCNPHNPTGTYITDTELRRVLDAVDPAVLIVLDEAYGEFADAPDFPDSLPMLAAEPNLLIARTFSKAYGLAGLRVGYGAGTGPALEALRRYAVPFTVTRAAQAGALAWLRCMGDLAGRLDRVRVGRGQLAAGLTERGFRVTPSQANFVHAVDAGRPWEDLLRDHAIAVRGAGPGVRVTVGSPADHDALFAAIDQIHSS